MKKISIVASVCAILFAFSCREEKKEVSTETDDAFKQVENVETELNEISKEIEEDTKELEEALDELDNI